MLTSRYTRWGCFFFFFLGGGAATAVDVLLVALPVSADIEDVVDTEDFVFAELFFADDLGTLRGLVVSEGCSRSLDIGWVFEVGALALGDLLHVVLPTFFLSEASLERSVLSTAVLTGPIKAKEPSAAVTSSGNSFVFSECLSCTTWGEPSCGALADVGSSAANVVVDDFFALLALITVLLPTTSSSSLSFISITLSVSLLFAAASVADRGDCRRGGGMGSARESRGDKLTLRFLNGC